MPEICFLLAHHFSTFHFQKNPKTSEVIISYGAYDACGVVDYRTERLQGLKGKDEIERLVFKNDYILHHYTTSWDGHVNRKVFFLSYEMLASAQCSIHLLLFLVKVEILKVFTFHFRNPTLRKAKSEMRVHRNNSAIDCFIISKTQRKVKFQFFT